MQERTDFIKNGNLSESERPCSLDKYVRVEISIVRLEAFDILTESPVTGTADDDNIGDFAGGWGS